MSAVPLLRQPAPVQEDRRYWLDEGSLQRLLDLMFSYVAGDRAFGTEEHLGWTISWETRYESRLFVRGSETGPDEFIDRPAGYCARIEAPGLVTDLAIERIIGYLENQGFSVVAYEQDTTTFEFTIGAY